MSGSRRLLLVGGGHAHLYGLRRVRDWVERGLDVTLIAPEPFWYSGMGPGLLSGRYEAEDDRVDIAGLVERGGGRAVTARVTRIDGAAREVELQDGSRLAYDVLSLNVGSGVSLEGIDGAAEHAFPVKPVQHFLEMRGRIRGLVAEGRGCRVVVIGGGAAGCETAANAWALLRGLGGAGSVCLVSGAERLLGAHAARAGRFMASWFEAQGVEVIAGRKAIRVEADSVHLDDGRRLDADVTVVATGILPSRLAGRSDLPRAADGSMAVNACLQCTAFPEIFGGGDCIAFRGEPLDRVGVYAVRQGSVLFRNLAAHAWGGPLRRFRPQRHYLLILNLGDGTGLLLWRGWVLHGRWAFRLKEWLDQRFIRSSQAAT